VEIFERASLQAFDKVLLSRNLERHSKACKLFSFKMKKSFSFGGRQIHRLNQASHGRQCTIQIGSTQFRYSKSQLAFISNKAVKHFRHSELPFEITLSTQLEDQNCFK
jgi:hypothetical protein